MKDNNLKKHEWTEKQAKSAHTPNFGKKYIGEPELLRMFGNVKNKKVLELGSGNGYWLDLLSRHGAIGTGVELEKKQLELADKSNHRTTYIQGDITKLEKLNLQKNSFDFVLLEHVLLEISSLKKINKIMTDAFGLLKKSGVIIISEIHPFAPSSKPDNIRTPNEHNYFSSGSVIQIVSRRLDGKETLYQDYHWTLSDLTSSLTQAGFYISEITEPRPSAKLAKKYSDLAYRQTTPMAFWIKAVKLK